MTQNQSCKLFELSYDPSSSQKCLWKRLYVRTEVKLQSVSTRFPANPKYRPLMTIMHLHVSDCCYIDDVDLYFCKQLCVKTSSCW